MKNLIEYSSLYPDLPINIILFFKMESDDKKIKNKKVYDFCSQYAKNNKLSKMPQPSIVSEICEALFRMGRLSVMDRKGPDGSMNAYMSIIKDSSLTVNSNLGKMLNVSMSCEIYGFPYILNLYRTSVRAIKHIKNNGSSFIGTCFHFFDGSLITARHCIEGADKIAIDGIDLEKVKAKIFFHPGKNMDLALIEIPNYTGQRILWHTNANILDEVITMGFPQTAGFHKFVVTEKAQISSRFSVTKGAVVGSGKDIWTTEDLLLINARIKGGNSGGPVINASGEVIGVSVQQNFGEGDYYDDLGYGTVIPMKHVMTGLIDKSEESDVTKDYEFSIFD